MSRAFASQPRTGLAGAPRSRARGGRSLLSSTPGSGARVRWDRLGRLAMLFVLAALLYLYLSAGLHMYSTWGQARRDDASLAQMEHENTRLVREHEALRRQGTVESQARRLGMMKQGEQQYVVSGLPNN
jgi:hypothetical protein